MNRTKRLLPLLLSPALIVLAAGCAVPLPAAELTATAESQIPPTPVPRVGGQVESASSGAPSSAASLRLEETPGADEPLSALAPLEDDELAGTVVATDGAEETPEAAEPTAETATEVPTPEVTATPEVVDTSAYAGQFLALLNEYRGEKGIPELTLDATLSAAAMEYAQYMATTGFFGHYPPSGSTPAGRIAAAGFVGQYQGEALSAGQPAPAVALSRLLGSAAHAAILLNANSVAVGIGHYHQPGSYYGHYWVVVTGNP